MAVKVKICGITNIDDALWAVDCGADAIGLIFARSPRQVTEDRARVIREKLPPFISAIGVFVDPDPESTRQIFDRLRLDFIQLHADNETEFLEKSGITPDKLIRVVSIASEADLETLEKVTAGTVLLDTKVEGMAGGTGMARVRAAPLQHFISGVGRRRRRLAGGTWLLELLHELCTPLRGFPEDRYRCRLDGKTLFPQYPLLRSLHRPAVP